MPTSGASPPGWCGACHEHLRTRHCNNFFVSCKRVFRPALEGRPAVVLSSNDGCIVVRSDKAKVLGVKMAQPAFQAKDLIERHSIAVISGNLQFYTDMSTRVMQAFGELVPAVEKYSIDECFLDLTGMPTPLASRFVHLKICVDAADWCAWGAANGIAPEVLFFVSMRPELLHAFKPLVFRDSLIENIRELMDVVPRLNIFADDDLAMLCREVKDKFAGIEPDALRPSGRFDPNLRRQVKRDADALTAQFAGYFAPVAADREAA